MAPGQPRPQDPSAIHGERRQEVEARQEEIREDDGAQESTGCAQVQAPLAHNQQQPRAQHESNRDVHRRPSKRHCDFFARLLRKRVQRGDTADWIERDITRPDTIVASHEHMPIFVGDHAGEDRQHEQRTIDATTKKENPREEGEEGPVQVDARPEPGSKFPFVFHA